jgi:hypothetical protein
MIIIDQIEKLINEHGSSSILRDHLALIKDQAFILDKAKTEAEKKLQICEIAKKQLQLENDDLKKKLRECEDLDIGFIPNMVIPPEGIK